MACGALARSAADLPLKNLFGRRVQTRAEHQRATETWSASPPGFQYRALQIPMAGID